MLQIANYYYTTNSFSYYFKIYSLLSYDFNVGITYSEKKYYPYL